MKTKPQNLADAMRYADEALLGRDVSTSLNLKAIQSIHRQKKRKTRLQMLSVLLLSCCTPGSLVFRSQNKKRVDSANGNNVTGSQMSTIANLDSALDGSAIMKPPAFQPPIELELEREAIAIVFLNRALRFRRAGEYPDEAKAALDFIVKTFPTTISADHARTLINSPTRTSILPGENL